MRLTPALYVRKWLAKLHPPLPQTPRESQQLLRILESSFRKHLDEVHPSPMQRQASVTNSHEIPLISSESSSAAANHYFSTVLTNPLLTRRNDRGGAHLSLTSGAVHVLAEASKNQKVTIAIVHKCAIDYLQGLRKGERVHEKDRLAQKLASWVYTTSLSMREAFFASTEVLELAVRIAGLDQQEAIAWDWLRMLYEHNFAVENGNSRVSVANSQRIASEDLLVSCIMRLSLQRGDLNDAAQQFVEACRYRSTSGRAASRPEDVSANLNYIPLEHCWKRLMASIIYYRNKHGIPESLFSEVMSYGMAWSFAPHFNTSIGSVYHPTSPSASSLSQHLQDLKSSNQFLSGQVGASQKFRRAMLLMILDGAQLSLDQSVRTQAQFLLDFAKMHYTEFLPATSEALGKLPSSLDHQIHTAQTEAKAHVHNFVWT